MIFGATGNLARLKLMPGFYHLQLEKKLPDDTRIVAVGRRPWDRATWLAEVKNLLQEQSKTPLDEAEFARFAERLDYHRGDLDQAECYRTLAETLGNRPHFSRNVAFYLAIGPVISVT